MKKQITSAAVAAAFFTILALTSCKEPKRKTVKVGLLHSLTGTMSISEIGVRDAELLAIKELNESGGVLGCQIKIVEEDGKSNPRMFAEKPANYWKKTRLPQYLAAGPQTPARQ